MRKIIAFFIRRSSAFKLSMKKKELITKKCYLCGNYSYNQNCCSK